MYKLLSVLVFCFVYAKNSHATLDESCKVDLLFTELADEKQLIMFGEIHGTREMPAYVAQVLCFLSDKKGPVKIGLEYLPAQLPHINRYIESSGLGSDKNALLGNPYWSNAYQDGRASLAMFNLIDQIRVQRLAGKDVEVFLFDDQSSADRDKAMAEHIVRELRHDPDTLHLLITGNIHSQVKKGVPWNQDYMTMGAYISESNFEIVSILLRHEGGTAWICTPDCKETSLASKQDNSMKTIEGELRVSSNRKHSYHLNVGKINGSGPAYLNME